MPRKPREKSANDLYHVVFRGTNKQTLFDSHYDYARYLVTMLKAKQRIGFELHAYCLMSNHVHMLVKVPYNNLPRISLSINASYAHFYNLKYSRTGHLFEIRYGSKPIESISHYRNTVRYIHQNPVHTGIIKNKDAHKFNWSSLKEFKKYAESNHLILSNEQTYLCDPRIALIEFNQNNTTHLSDFFTFHTTVSKDGAFEHDDHRLTDQEAYELIIETVGDKVEFIKDLQKMDVSSRNAILVEIKKQKLSNAQIARLTGIGKNIIQRA